MKKKMFVFDVKYQLFRSIFYKKKIIILPFSDLIPTSCTLVTYKCKTILTDTFRKTRSIWLSF